MMQLVLGNRCNIATAGKHVFNMFKTPKGKHGFYKDNSRPSVNKPSDLLWDGYQDLGYQELCSFH